MCESGDCVSDHGGNNVDEGKCITTKQNYGAYEFFLKLLV